jgi:hypothetical protein
VYTQRITLLEALTGFEFHITHLDGRILVVKNWDRVRTNLILGSVCMQV